MSQESAYADFDNSKSIPLQGLNERIVAESIPLGDLSKLIGLRQNRLGELVRYPGEDRIPGFEGLSSVRGLFVIGDYIIIQTALTLIRARINEFFPEFIQTSPELLPDITAGGGGGSPLDPEDMSYALLNYHVSGVNPGVATTDASWTAVPLNIEIADSANRITWNGAGGRFNVTAAVYPAFVRFDGWVAIGGANSVTGGNASQWMATRILNISAANTAALGGSARGTTAINATNGKPALHCHIKGRVQITAPTIFELQAYTKFASNIGLPSNLAGEPNDVFAQLEILIEE